VDVRPDRRAGHGGGLAGLLSDATYAAETSNWAAQAIGQDAVNVLLAYPALLVLAWLAAKGSLHARDPLLRLGSGDGDRRAGMFVSLAARGEPVEVVPVAIMAATTVITSIIALRLLTSLDPGAGVTGSRSPELVAIRRDTPP
jgi:hypothetical protein